MNNNSQRRRRAIPALLGLTIAAAPLVSALPAQAAIASPFKPVFSINAPGDIVLVGNTVLTCGPNLFRLPNGKLQEPDATQKNCDDARRGVTTVNDGTLNNNIYNMQYVDIDGDPSTFNSSSSDLAIPAGASVAYAGLYWSGSPRGNETSPGAPDPSQFNKVLLKVPGSQGYQTVTSTDNTQVTNSQGELSAPATDVTDIVRAAGSGTYTVANIQAGTGVGRNGGWALVVAYTSDTEPMRNLTVFSGYGNVEKPTTNDPTANDATMQVSGFTTPLAGEVRTRLGVVAFEGDLGITGDTFRLNGATVSDRINKPSNAFNSVISDMGQYVTTRTPSDVNNFGVDVKRYGLTNYLKNKATSAQIRLTTVGDGYGPRVVTFATELYAPDVQVKQAVVDVNGGTLREGDTVKYTLATSNKGGDDASSTTIKQKIPAGLTYTAGSAKIDGKTVDATYDATSRTVSFPVGDLAMKASRSLTFEATLDQDVADQLVLPATADVTYDAKVSGQHFTGYSNTVQVVADVPRADLAVSANVNPGVVEASTPGDVTYTVEVSNLGPRTAFSTQLQPTLPKGVTIKDVQGAACNAMGCTLGDLASGETRTVTITASFPGAEAASSAPEATFSATSTTPDPQERNNSASASYAVGNAPVATDDEVTVTANSSAKLDVLANDTDADNDDLKVTNVSQGENGSTVLNSDGTVTYTPNQGFVGKDSYSYQVTDGVFTRTATVAVNVQAPAPKAVDDQVKVSRSEVSVDVLANDVSPLGTTLKVVSVTNGNLGGSAKVETTSTGETRVVYAPPAKNVGVDTLTYVVEDAYGQQSSATIEVTVTNSAPVLAQEPRVETKVGQTPAALSFTDPDGDAYTVRDVKGLPDGLTLNSDGTWGGKAKKVSESDVTFELCDDRNPQDCTTVTIHLVVTGDGGTDNDGTGPIPTDPPTTTPAPVPTDEPTSPAPTDEPTYPVPTNEPTMPEPTYPVPTNEPTMPTPTDEPTNPAPVPTDEPTKSPVPVPTPMPTDTTPAPVPTNEPTNPAPVPTDEPTKSPVPTDEPTTPTVPVSTPPTVAPVTIPEGPSTRPTATTVPSGEPTRAPATTKPQAQAGPAQLAYTGAPVGILVGAGLLLIGAGAYLMRRSSRA